MSREMKDTSISGLTQIPKTWNVVPLKMLFSFSKGLSITKSDLTDEGIKVISYGQIHSKNCDGVHATNELIRFTANEFQSNNSLVKCGGVIFADTSEDLNGCGNAIYITDEVYGGYHTVVLNPKEAHDYRYLAYLFKTDAWRTELRKQLTEVKVFSITQFALKNMHVILPSNEEMIQIADFLDSKCSSIDQAIQKQKDIIDKLAEFRQATITQVVTHGVNSDDSIRRFQKNDYIWFDEIPQNWKTYKLKYITKLSKEKAINKENYIGLENVESKTGKFIGSQVEPDGDAIIFHQNDVLFGKLRPYLSKSLLVEQEGCCSGEFLVITPKQIVPKYLLYITLSKAFVEHVNSSTYGAKMPRSNWEFVRNMIIPLPTESEQKEIISYLDKKLESIDNVIESTNTIIQKLEEYKKSLIYNAVTGKIDCRGEVK